MGHKCVGNGNCRPVGRCGECGGVVSVPVIWHGVNRAPATCERCGAVRDGADGLPTVKMKPRPRHEWAGSVN